MTREELRDYVDELVQDSINEVLDKIIAEIEQTFLDDGAMQEYTVDSCLRIINKYKAESEE